MTSSRVWSAFVDDAGHFGLDRGPEFRAWVKKFAGQEVTVVVKKKAAGQGSQSMRYYRGVIIPAIAEACGYHADEDSFNEIHDALAWRFLRLADHPQFGTPRRQSTAKDCMSQEEMSRYIDQVITWAETSIPDCRVPRPEEKDLDTCPEWTPSEASA